MVRDTAAWASDNQLLAILSGDRMQTECTHKKPTALVLPLCYAEHAPTSRSNAWRIALYLSLFATAALAFLVYYFFCYIMYSRLEDTASEDELEILRVAELELT
jgi:hypothetical protein